MATEVSVAGSPLSNLPKQEPQGQTADVAFLSGGRDGWPDSVVRRRTIPRGAVETWPHSLKTALSICLGSRSPMVMYWGRQHLTQFYNDDFVSILGAAKHPVGLGQSAQMSPCG